MLNKHTLKFLMGILIVTIFLIAIAIPIFKYFGFEICFKYFVLLSILFSVTNLIFYLFFIYFFEKNPNKFLQIFLFLTIVKMLVYLLILVVFIFKAISGIKCFLISFFILYLFYTFYEVVVLSKYLKKYKD